MPLHHMKHPDEPWRPKLAMCNIFSKPREALEFSREHGFDGIDWSLEPGNLPETPSQESEWVRRFRELASVETRFHCAFPRLDIGHDDQAKAEAAAELFQRVIRLVSKLGGRCVTVHIGLGRDSTEPLSWEATIENLSRLVRFGAFYRVTVCVENLAWGWTSRPNLFEKLIRKSGAGVTLDIGHAHVSEGVRTHLYTVEDFVSPHPERVFNVHIYHKERPGRGHVPPESLRDIQDRLRVAASTGCPWWVMEVREEQGMLRTKEIVEEFLQSPERRRVFPALRQAFS